jgi:hypothetical protein
MRVGRRWAAAEAPSLGKQIIRTETTMEWTIVIHENYTEVITTGIADDNGTQAMAKAMAIQLSKTKTNRVLMDHRQITSVVGSISGTYKRQGEFKGFGVPKQIKIAEIVNQTHMHFFSFLKTLLKNIGYNVEIFFDKETALTWLLEDTE